MPRDHSGRLRRCRSPRRTQVRQLEFRRKRKGGKELSQHIQHWLQRSDFEPVFVSLRNTTKLREESYIIRDPIEIWKSVRLERTWARAPFLRYTRDNEEPTLPWLIDIHFGLVDLPF